MASIPENPAEKPRISGFRHSRGTRRFGDPAWNAMTPGQFLTKWTAEAEAMHRRGVLVNGAGLCHEILTDFRAVMASQAESVLSLPEAAARSGYTAEHLGRMVREGRISNA